MDRILSARRDLSYGLIIRNTSVAGYQEVLEIPQPAVATRDFLFVKSNYSIFINTFAPFNDILK